MHSNDCSQINSEKKTITIDLWKATALFIGAIITTAGGSVWASLASVNSDHFTVSAHTTQIGELKDQNKITNTFIIQTSKDIGEIKGALGIK